MRLETAQLKTLMVTRQGVVHIPFTLYLNMRYDNPHTRVVAARALRVLGRLIDAFNIDFAERALEARCLEEKEKAALRQLAFHPIETIEAMSDRAVREIASTKKTVASAKIKDAVQANTASKQLVQIADFLTWYQEKVINPRMPLASPVTEALQRVYSACGSELKVAIASTKSAHPHKIRSVPTGRFLQIYSVVFLKPREVLQTHAGRPSCNVLRDRAMILLAAEGIRPGALGNILLSDFKWIGGNERGYIVLKDNTARRSKRLSTATPTQKGTRSKQNYNSELTISIWPTTAKAIRDYIDVERQTVTSNMLRNRSEGFLFLAEHSGPIGDRGTISTIFRRASEGLEKLGLLSKATNDPYLNGEKYQFSAYLLRHSAASLFYTSKARQMRGEVVEDLMKMRFGWAQKSGMPRLYAQRAIADEASLTVEDFVESLLAEANEKNDTTNKVAK